MPNTKDWIPEKDWRKHMKKAFENFLAENERFRPKASILGLGLYDVGGITVNEEGLKKIDKLMAEELAKEASKNPNSGLSNY